MFKNLFDLFNEEAEELFNDLHENFNNLNEEDEENECHSYSRCVMDKYEDGEKVEHHDKIVKDGKVVKNENFNKAIENKEEKECPAKKEKADAEPKDEIKQLREENKELSEENKKLSMESFKNAAKLNECENYCKSLEEENKKFREKLNKIQDML